LHLNVDECRRLSALTSAMESAATDEGALKAQIEDLKGQLAKSDGTN